MEFLKRKLYTIQNSDEKTKKRWLTALSGISMAIIIVFWFIYMNAYLSNLSSEQPVQSSAPSFWSIFKTGLVAIGHSISQKIGDAWSYIFSHLTKFGGGKTLEITNPLP